MAYLADFVCETAVNPGTGTTVNLLGAAAGLPVRTFSSAFTNGDRIMYTITDGSAMSESGIGTYHTGPTISRDTVKSNTSSSTARLNFTGSVFVFAYPPASQIVFMDELQKVSLPGGLAVTGLADFSLGGAKIASAPAASATAPLRADQTWQIVNRTSISSLATQTLLLPVAFRRFRLTLQAMIVSIQNSAINLRFSSDGGNTALTAATYTTTQLTTNITGAVGGSGSAAITSIPLSYELDITSSAQVYDASMEIWPGTSGQRAVLRGTGYGVRGTGPTWASFNFTGSWNGTPALMNAFQMFPSLGGTMTGTAIVEGMP